jgi:hypothetical protein
MPPVISYFRCLLNEQFTAGRMLGPRQLIAMTLAQIQVLGRLRRHAPTGTADDAVRLLARYAEFAGRLHQDAGGSIAAMYWSDRATDWAQAAGDYQMVAYLMVRKSNIALLNQDAREVIALAAARGIRAEVGSAPTGAAGPSRPSAG